jgi:hypothetical protein
VCCVPCVYLACIYNAWRWRTSVVKSREIKNMRVFGGVVFFFLFLFSHSFRLKSAVCPYILEIQVLGGILKFSILQKRVFISFLSIMLTEYSVGVMEYSGSVKLSLTKSSDSHLCSQDA